MDESDKKVDPIMDRMNKLEEVLDEYENSLGLNKFNKSINEGDAQKYLSMSRGEIEKLTIEQCSEAALLISSLALHIQRAINREASRITWTKNYISEMICKKSHNFSGKWDHQDMQAILEDDVSRKLYEIQKYAQQRVDRLTYISSSIRSMSDVYINLQRSRMSMRNG